MLNELAQEYIVTARVKGVAERRIIWGHALRNAAVPLVTVIALSYASLLEGSVLTETVFAWPGLGLYLTNSLQNADMNAVLGGTLSSAPSSSASTCSPTCSTRLLDPRVRRRRDRPTVSLRDWLLTDQPAVAPAGPRWARPTAPGCAFRAQPAGDARPGDRRCCWSLVAIFADLLAPYRPDRRRRPAHRAPAAAVAGALDRHRRPGPRHLLAASSTARASRCSSSRWSRSSPRRSGCWSAPSPAISAAGSTPC